jgi:hypothetical protein
MAGAEACGTGDVLSALLVPETGLALFATDCTSDGAIEAATATNASADMSHLHLPAQTCAQHIFSN